MRLCSTALLCALLLQPAWAIELGDYLPDGVSYDASTCLKPADILGYEVGRVARAPRPAGRSTWRRWPRPRQG